MGLTKFTEKLISDSFKTSISGSDNTESASFSSRVTLVEGGTTSKTLVSSSVLSSPSQGTIRLATNGVNTDVDSGLQAGDSPTFAGGTITGDFTVGGTLTTQEVHTEFESASILFTSGSTKFGDSGDDIHNMTGSIRVSGSAANESFILGHNLGIGTNNPSSKLHVAGGSGNDVEIHLGDADGDRAEFIYRNDADFEIRSTGATGNFELHNEGNRSIIFNTNGSERMRIVGGGNVGIGTDNPSANLHIGGTTPTIYLGDSGAEDTKLVYRGNQIDYYIGHDDSNNALTMGFGTTVGSDAVLVISGSNVGIGITNPASLLTVAGDNKAIDLRSADYSNVFIGSAGSSGAGLDRGLIVIREDGSNNTLLYGDGVAYFGGAVTSSLLLVEGVSNYQGIEIKGDGASRPQLKFRNVNQGTLGQIYGTE